MYKLVIQDDEGKTTVVPLIRDEITIGRKEGNTIRLTERNVSRRHARIVRFDGTIQIEDLGSYNGVRVNGAKIQQRTALSVSDRAQIGDYLIEVKAEATEQPGPATIPMGGVVGHAGASIDDGKTVPTMRAMSGLDQTLPGGPSAAAFASSPTQPVAAAVPVETDDAPTARAETRPAGGGPAARLVVLSSNFAGQEWRLTGAQTVIGRTDENDVVINHRSISRNHAKVVREAETGRYTISDLQSSNGVRVNGEEYGKVELRRGDIVDLGHVRLRFVEAGEDFVFGRDAQIADVPAEGGSRTWLVAALALVLVGGGFAAYKLLGSKSSSPKPVAGLGSAGSGSGSSMLAGGSGSGSAIAMITPDAAPAAGSGSAVGSGGDVGSGAPVASAKLAAKIAECRGLAEKEAWADLMTCGAEALEIDGGSAEAAGIRAQGKRESANSLQFDNVTAAAAKRDYAKVALAYGKIDADSVYRERAREVHDKAHDTYLAAQLARGRDLAAKGKCSELTSLASSSGKVWSDVGAQVKSISCTATTVTPPPTGGGDPPPVCNYEELLSKMNDFYAAGDWGKALVAAEEAIACNGTPTAPKKKALGAACKLRNASKITKYYAKVGSAVPVSALTDCFDLLPK